MAKTLLQVAGNQVTLACGSTNLCAGLPTGIEGAVHAIMACTKPLPPPPVPDPATTTATDNKVPTDTTPTDTSDMELRTQPPPPPDPLTPSVPEPLAAAYAEVDLIVMVLVDVWNGFNELNRSAMLWLVQHLWPKGSRFALNCYKHQSKLYH